MRKKERDVCGKCHEDFIVTRKLKNQAWCEACNEKYVKIRRCLKCNKKFTSIGYNNRICVPCSFRNQRETGLMYQKQGEKEREMI